MTDPRQPFWVKCEACSHCWAAAYLPMEVSDFAKVAKNQRCPMCASSKVIVAKQKDGVLNEPQPNKASA